MWIIIIYHLWMNYPQLFMENAWRNFVSDFADKNHSLILAPLLKKTALDNISENQFFIACENRGMKIYLEAKKKEIEGKFSFWLKKPAKIHFLIKEKSKKNIKNIDNAPLLVFKKNKDEIIKKAGLQPQCTFDNFAVSSSNQMAYTAAQTVSKNISTSYNPLFIYGGVGVGKTHLMQAMAHKILERDLNQKILYCTSEEFTNDLIELIRVKNTANFRKKYRFLNVLLIDDIQFIAGKSYIQEELYHTFNTIIKNGGQIILTSDKPPKEIKKLEDRLRSRFSGGLSIDIQKPDFELLTAILLIKAKKRNIQIDIEAAKLIAEKVEDARELEGKLLEIYAKVIKTDEAISKEIIERIEEKERFQKNSELKNRLLPQDIIKAVCLYYNIKPSHIKNSSRKEKVSFPRQIIMFILRNTLKIKYEEIAFILKRKDHTTIIHGVEKITNLILKNPLFKEEIDRITNSIPYST